MYSPPPRYRALALGALVLAAQACSDLPSAAPDAAPRRGALGAQAPDPADPVVRALASALAEPAARARLLEDLRDSPFPKHRLHLKSYLRGNSGGALLAAGARRAGIRPARLNALLDSLPDMEILMPVSMDRVGWKGTPDLVVTGSALAGAEIHRRGSLSGYTVEGTPVTIPVYEPVDRPQLILVRTRQDFGTDPEARRRGTPRKERGTISTMMLEESTCDPLTAVIECGSDTGTGGGGGSIPTGGGIQLSTGDTYQCMVGAYGAGDGDGDGVRDDCERELAHKFRPYLAVKQPPWYSFEGDEDLRREEHWAGTLGETSNSVRIFYALSYYRDLGDPTCFGCTSHVGDSEWINLHLFYQNGFWYVRKARLSAHWRETAESTETVSATNLQFPGDPGRVRVWVAEYKHANYKSRHACNNGGVFDNDDCSGNSFVLGNPFYEVEVLPDANLGNSWHIYRNCVPSREIVSSANECYWMTGAKFRGWTGNYSAPAAGVYHEALTAHYY
jgi:hypothetical protein